MLWILSIWGMEEHFLVSVFLESLLIMLQLNWEAGKCDAVDVALIIIVISSLLPLIPFVQ